MRTLNNVTAIPAFDEIVFEARNKEYGAYVLRRIYRKNVIFSMMMAVAIATMTVLIPYFKMKSHNTTHERTVQVVTKLTMTNIDQPIEEITPPEVKPPTDMVQQAKYIPPVVVDSVKPGDDLQFMTADEAEEVVKNEDVFEVPEQIQPEIEEVEPEQAPFYVVEEDPSFPGGQEALLKYIYDNVKYPEIAIENNIQGRITIKFCVTADGSVNQITVLKGIDPELDNEAVRVISTLPKFRPGKQGGKPVPVWYVLPVMFKLSQ
ncbi:MAG TPA: TonB family protein [Bacteroidales bacterium]|nr:TonB family protein [Bacteroidales bacterium]